MRNKTSTNLVKTLETTAKMPTSKDKISAIILPQSIELCWDDVVGALYDGELPNSEVKVTRLLQRRQTKV